jgi:hypothetical protein
MNWRIARMDGIAPRYVPPVLLILVDEGISTLEVHRILELGIIFVLDYLPRDLLLDDLLAPVVVEPGLLNFFLVSVRVEQRVLGACDVQVHLKVDDVVMQ